MEVQGRQPDPLKYSRERYEQRLEELQASNRERVERARLLLAGLSEARQEAARRSRESNAETASSVDTLDLSSTGRTREVASDEEARRARVEALAEAYRSGTLGSPERLERTAESILRG